MKKFAMENFTEEQLSGENKPLDVVSKIVKELKDATLSHEGKALEDLADDELESLYRKPLDAVSKILKDLNWARQEDKESKYEKPERENVSDDGPVKGLIVSGDYINLGHYVGIQRTLNGERGWIWKGYNDSHGTVCTAQQIGLNWEFAEETADDIVTLCRRKFKKDEIILYIADDTSPEIGIVFTENKLYTFDDKKLEYAIAYAEMEDIDFDEDSVTIIVSSGEEVTLYCGDEEKYSKGVYNLLMDIKDRLAQA